MTSVQLRQRRKPEGQTTREHEEYMHTPPTTTSTATTNNRFANTDLSSEPYYESILPTADSTQELPKRSNSAMMASAMTASTDATSDCTAIARPPPNTDESRTSKMITRVVSGAGMVAVFCGCVYCGHLYVCLIVALSEFLLFRELVKVRYNVYYTTIQDRIPLFRTTQWMWFFISIFYTYGDFVNEVIIQNNAQLHYLAPYAQYITTYCAFGLYSGTFVLTIATMQTGHIKFQLNQLCWTVLVLCLTVGQMKYIMHNIFNGLFWFTFPFLLVCVNDIMAYVCGITCGRKFIHRPFIRFSPNKTWEGFIGGGICTMVAAWYLSRVLAQYSWMTCPTNEFRLMPLSSLNCENHHVFQEAQSIIPDQVFEIIPTYLVKLIPGIVEICSVKGVGSTTAVGAAAALLVPCISGEPTHTFHHVELVLHNVYPIQIHALWLGLFASVVGPFGGFLASAIKRAYGIKDFDSFIPGHGGVTDRLDCQFLMALCTWVHYNTFVKLATVSVPKLMYMYQMLSDAEKKAFVEGIRRAAK